MDTYYYKTESPKAEVGCLKITAMVFVFAFTLMTVFFMPIDFAAISMSFDPGFSLFALIVIGVFVIKLLCLASFYVLLFFDLTNLGGLKLACQILLWVGFGIFLAAFSIVAIEIWLLTKSFLAIISHPFIWNFGLFFITALIVNISAYIPNATESPYAFYPVPQEQMQYDLPVEMGEMPHWQPIPKIFPEYPVEIPVLKQPVPPPEIELKEPELVQPEPPKEEKPAEKPEAYPKFPMFEPLPKRSMTQKKQMQVFVPYFIPSN